VRILLGLALVVAVFMGAIVLASELGGEVVVISTSDDRGVPFETSLWIVEYRGSPYLRAGDRDSAWFQRLKKNPTIQMERRGETATYRAVPDPTSTENINHLMARDYGLADQLIGLMRDPSKTIAIRLEKVQR
jgi:hypothetical protein